MLDSIGRPPAGYNPYVHGPYNPGMYYGKADTHWKDVKLAEIPNWLSRRSKNPLDLGRAASRAFYRHCTKWVGVGKPGRLVQMGIIVPTIFYFLQYQVHTDERRSKYH